MSHGLSLLAAVLVAGSPATLTQLEPHVLIAGPEVQAYNFIRQHYRLYHELPATQTIHEGTGVRLPTPVESLGYYIEQVYERHQYNEIRERFSPLREALAANDLDAASESIEGMSRVLRRRQRPGHSAGVSVNLHEGFQQVVDRAIRVRGSGGVSGVITGWPQFDAITGGYQNADLVTWVGRMGLGKTYVLLKQADYAHSQGETVLYVTTEMSTEQTCRRLAAIRLGINPNMLKTGNLSTHQMRRIQALALDIAGSERFKILSVGMSAKVSVIEALCDEFGPSIVFIDGVYLLKPTEQGKNATQRDRVSGVYDEVKALTLEVDRPFIVSTQFNRQAGKGGSEGTLENIGFTDAVGTHSSVIVALKDGPTENKRDSRLFDFLKGREGESGTVAINFKFAPFNMEEMTREERAEEGEVNAETTAWMRPRRRTE